MTTPSRGPSYVITSALRPEASHYTHTKSVMTEGFSGRNLGSNDSNCYAIFILKKPI